MIRVKSRVEGVMYSQYEEGDPVYQEQHWTVSPFVPGSLPGKPTGTTPSKNSTATGQVVNEVEMPEDAQPNQDQQAPDEG